MNLAERTVAQLREYTHVCPECGTRHRQPSAGRTAITVVMGSVCAYAEWHAASQVKGWRMKAALRTLSILNGAGVASILWTASTFTTYVLTHDKAPER